LKWDDDTVIQIRFSRGEIKKPHSLSDIYNYLNDFLKNPFPK